MQRMIINLLTYYWDRPTLFDGWKLPKQVTDKQGLIDRLLFECGELEIYPTNPDLLEYMIGKWSTGKLPSWQKIADILDLEYNPIWNVDGVTTHTERTAGSQDTGADRNVTSSGTIKNNGQEDTREQIGEEWSETESETTETVNSLSADNSSGWSNDTKTDFESTKNKDGEKDTDRTENKTHDDTTTDNRTEHTTDSENVTHETTNVWEDRREGNIGVTTTQHMMTEELEFWKGYDLYGYLVDEFRKEFCLLIY